VTLDVHIERLHCRRGRFTLGPLSLQIPASARVAIVGPSGSGKTTLLRCLAGLERPGAGTIRIGGRTVFDDGTDLPPAERELGLVFQDGALWPHMNALQHLCFAAPGLARNDARALLARGGLDGHEGKKPAQLSGGEAQRLGLLRALAPAPKVLLLDEPLRSVDVHQRDGLVLLVRELCDEGAVTTILVTHDRDEALALADHLVVMRDGALVEQGAAVELLERPRTAFTASFLRGAACLSVRSDGDGAATVFGRLPQAPAGADAQRLVVFPGEAVVDDHGPAEGRVLAVLPGEGGGLRVRAAVEDQIVVARAETAPVGAAVRLRLAVPPRLLPQVIES
jgi:iron(III) transport system ATP-binding protein